MSKHNLIKPVLAAVICILGATGSASAASDATAQFKSSITVGTCDISFKETMPMSFHLSLLMQQLRERRLKLNR